MGCDFPSDSPLSTSFFCFWTKNYFEFCSAKSSPTCLFALKDWDSCNALGASSPNCDELFHSGKLVFELILKDDRKVDLDFKWATSHFPHQISSAVAVVTIKIWLHQPSRNWFSKAPQAFLMLNLSRESKVALHFSSVRSRGTAIFNSNLTTWKE